MSSVDMASLVTLALAGGLAGAVGWSVRQVPSALGGWLKKALTSCLEVRKAELTVLLDRVIFQCTGKRRQQIDKTTPAGGRAPANGWHFFRHEGNLLAVKRDRDEGGGPKDGGLESLMRAPCITVYCLGGFGPIETLLKAAEDLDREDKAGEARSSYYTASRWHGWERHEARSMGGMSRVALPEGMADEIVDSASTFFASGEWYRDMGANWAAGWLFEGAPGTGKSRTARAIAQHLGVNFYTLDIGRPGLDNDEVHRLIRQMAPRSVLLLDDFDKTVEMLGEQGQKEGGSQVTLAGILSALELPGAAGRLVIITANSVGLLDPDGTGAMTRPGRVDRHWHFGHADEYQAKVMLDQFEGGGMRESERDEWLKKSVGSSTAAIFSDLLRRTNPSRNT